MEEHYQKIAEFLDDLRLFASELFAFVVKRLHLSFLRFEEGKGAFVAALYRQRGKRARRLVHSSIAGLSALGMLIAPVIASEFPGRSLDPWTIPTTASVLSATASESLITDVSAKGRDRVIIHTVAEGETVAGVAEKYGVSTETVLWQNDLTEKTSIKVGQTLDILPVTGISHKVQKGDTISSIAKRYDAESQAIVDFDYNVFVNDETFELAVGQTIIVPDGVKPAETPVAPRIRPKVPDAGTVVASGNFVWPAGGSLTQTWRGYHPGIDIANRGAPDVVAADGGKVVYAGCLSWGYGCHVIIDHGNGYRTLYAHFSRVYVSEGQGVNRGTGIGKMGCTGRCSGTHVHFEVIKNGVKLNPLSVLQ